MFSCRISRSSFERNSDTGYISKELWRELLDEKQDDHTFDIYRCDIESLGDDTKTLDEVMEIVIELIKKVK